MKKIVARKKNNYNIKYRNSNHNKCKYNNN